MANTPSLNEQAKMIHTEENELHEFENAEEIIKQHSIKEWPDDYEMQIHFIDKQRKAINELQKRRPDDIDLDTYKKIRERAKKELPFDFEMRLHTQERQIDSYRKLKNVQGFIISNLPRRSISYINSAKHLTTSLPRFLFLEMCPPWDIALSYYHRLTNYSVLIFVFACLRPALFGVIEASLFLMLTIYSYLLIIKQAIK